MKKTKKNILPVILFGLVGALLIAFAGFKFNESVINPLVKRSGWTKTQAQIVGFYKEVSPETGDDGEPKTVDSYTATVQYEVNNETYQSDIDYGKSVPKQGDKIDFYYNPNNLGEGAQDVVKWYNYLWLGLGVVGLGLIIYAVKIWRRIRRSKQQSEEVAKLQNEFSNKQNLIHENLNNSVQPSSDFVNRFKNGGQK